MAVSIEEVKQFYASDIVVKHYARATARLGLWASEEWVICRNIADKDARILEVGCGTGRIAIGLAELGYRHLLGVELSRPMVKEARRINEVLGLGVSFQVGDACALEYEDGLFDAAIFGFNGLMQIPGRENRRRAMAEIGRVLKPGGKFIFTTHDRNINKYKKLWHQESRRWDRGEQAPELLEYGDRWEETDLGMVYIHVPVPEAIREDLRAAGFVSEWDQLRSQIVVESNAVREFSDECRFWVARKLEAGR